MGESDYPIRPLFEDALESRGMYDHSERTDKENSNKNSYKNKLMRLYIVVN